jgi:hypothetical protein
MPSDIVVKLIDRISKLEARVENLMSYQKWQMGLLTAILLIAVKSWMGK